MVVKCVKIEAETVWASFIRMLILLVASQNTYWSPKEVKSMTDGLFLDGKAYVLNLDAALNFPEILLMSGMRLPMSEYQQKPHLLS